MRRSALLGTLLLLSGCSGLGHFFQDTARIPGQNPNATTGVSENLLRSRGERPSEDAILPQQGNVWPGPPQPLPTLSDVSRNGGQNAGDLLGGTGNTLPRGGSMSLGEQNQIQGGAPTNESGFSGGALSDSIPDPAVKFRSQHPQSPSGSNAGSNAGSSGTGSSGGSSSGTGAGTNIVIPNGDGTSTVISPDGTVKTVKGTPK